MPPAAYHTQILLDAARCLGLAAVAASVGWGIGAHLPRRPGMWGWALIAAPLFTPSLLVTYTYAALGLRLTAAPVWLTVFYSVLVMLKLTPLAVLVRCAFPPALSSEARFCAQLLDGQSAMARWLFRLRALGATPWIAFGLIFLLAFTDFEVASLLSIKTWPVMLFDAHAGGLEISQSLGRILMPLCVEFAALLGLLQVVRKAARHEPHSGANTDPRRWALPAAGAIAAVTTGWPVLRIVGQSLGGWSVVGLRETLGEDVMMSLCTAVVAAGGVWLFLPASRRRTAQLFAVLPGLLGALVLSLIILAFVHASPPEFVSSQTVRTSWFRSLAAIAESPIPLAIAQMLLLAPVALMLRAMLAANRPGESLHLARMAGSRRLIWDLSLERKAAALGLLFILAYFEFTAGSILAPVRLTPVCVRLHNLAHYGQTAALSAMLLAATIAPAALLALTLGTARLYARHDAR